MATVKSNIGEVTASIRAKLAKLSDKEYMPRVLSFDLIDLMTKRIHIEGKGSNEAQIGTYSFGYMQLRTGIYNNSDEFTKGKNKGKVKNAGVFTRGDKKGQARPKYNRSGDTKVIISLTRQLENDWSVIATDKGYGIGFLNPHNFDKARWTEATYSKKIFSLSQTELKYVTDTVQRLTTDALK